MSLVAIKAGEELLIKFGNGASPEVFAHSCLINTTREVSFKSNITEVEVRDCTNPSKPAVIRRKVKSIDFSVAGAGQTDAPSFYAMIEWWKSALAKNVTIEQTGTGAQGGWTGTGPMIIADFKTGGAAGEFQDFTGTFVPSDAFDWVEAS